MKVSPSDIRAQTDGARSQPASTAAGGAFKAALADASAEDVKLRKGERMEAVDGHRYAEIVSGKREGMYVNTSGNARHGEAFVLVRKEGVNYHVYGSGKDREVVAVGKPAAENAEEPPADIKLRKGEKAEPVEGHSYSDIVSGKREGMYINTSGNARHGEAFVLARRNGIEYHIYGSGSDRLVVALKPGRDDD